LPTYEYHCDSCERNFDVVQSFHDDPLTSCPTCGSAVRKVFGNVGIVFKGSGFYKTDSRKGESAKGSESSEAANGAGPGPTPSESANGDTSAPAPAAASPSTSEQKTTGSPPPKPDKAAGSDKGSSPKKPAAT
jgi:putative FmdB family regulatory protein